MIHPKDLTISVLHVKSQVSQMFVEQFFLPNLKINSALQPLFEEKPSVACEIQSQRASITKGFSIHIANLLCVIP